MRWKSTLVANHHIGKMCRTYTSTERSRWNTDYTFYAGTNIVIGGIFVLFMPLIIDNIMICKRVKYQFFNFSGCFHAHRRTRRGIRTRQERTRYFIEYRIEGTEY